MYKNKELKNLFALCSALEWRAYYHGADLYLADYFYESISSDGWLHIDNFIIEDWLDYLEGINLKDFENTEFDIQYNIDKEIILLKDNSSYGKKLSIECLIKLISDDDLDSYILDVVQELIDFSNLISN